MTHYYNHMFANVHTTFATLGRLCVYRLSLSAMDTFWSTRNLRFTGLIY
jgi:hypothetical protein